MHGSYTLSLAELLSIARLRRAQMEIDREIEQTPYPKQPWHNLDGLLWWTNVPTTGFLTN